MALDLSKYTVPAARPLPVILLLDGTGSIYGEKIASLNSAENEMIESFKLLSAKEVDINLGIITFGSNVDTPVQLQSVKNIEQIHLEANGGTPMGTALKMAKIWWKIKSLSHRKDIDQLLLLCQMENQTIIGRDLCRLLSKRGVLQNVIVLQ